MEKQARQRLRRIAIVAAAGAGLLVLCVFAIGMGSVSIPPARVVEVLLGRVASTEPDAIIVTNMRLARVVASLLGGAALALSGLLLQSLFHNPIADPYILGISSGARLSVGIMMLGGVLTGVVVTGPWMLFVGALAGAMAAMGVMLAFSSRVRSTATLLIIGMMVGYLCSALVGVLVAFSDDSGIADFTRWSMGSFGLLTWPKIGVMTVVCLVFFTFSFLLSKDLNALMLGEAYAVTMGVRVKRLRVLIIVCSGVLTAVVTAFAGLISFVGMSVPHIARMTMRTNDARILIPTTLLFGGIFGVGCDLIARTVIAPNELSIGTVTSFVGVPIVLYLLLSRRKES